MEEERIGASLQLEGSRSDPLFILARSAREDGEGKVPQCVSSTPAPMLPPPSPGWR